MRKFGFIVLGIVTAAALSVAPTATADPAAVDTHVPFSSSFFNPCTGEFGAGSGFLHFKSQSGTGPGFHFTFELNVESFQGVTFTGAQYVVTEQESDHFNADSDFAPFNENVEVVFHLQRLGEDGTFVLGDDFYERLRVDFVVNANGVVTVNNFVFTADCR